MCIHIYIYIYREREIHIVYYVIVYHVIVCYIMLCYIIEADDRQPVSEDEASSKRLSRTKP